MSHAWYALVAAVAVAVAALGPLTPALESREALQARVFAAGVAAVACAVVARWKLSGVVATALAVAAAALGIAAAYAHFDASARCIATYDGRPVIVGRTLLPHAQEYVQNNPSSAADLLLDAGGAPDRVWTEASIASCRRWLGWGGLSAVPLLALAVCASLAQRRFAIARRASPAPRPTAGAATYDAFISYRHTDPDKANAAEILDALESRGLRVAIDFRDFRANEHFLSEMERCIKESRFILCVVSPRYIDSDNCSEEALITKTLDLAERRKRLVPLIFERVELPAWMYGIVGIDFTDGAAVDPVERLLVLLKGQ